MEIEDYKEGNNFISLDNLLEILGNSTRRVVLSKLAKVPHSTSELAHELGISRQAIHSQINILKDANIIEELDNSRPGGKYRIKSRLAVRIDVNPDYFNIEYSSKQIEDKSKLIRFKDMTCSDDYKKIKAPNKRLKFLGEKIRDIEK